MAEKYRLCILLSVLTLLSIVIFSSISVQANQGLTAGGLSGSAATIDNEGDLLVIGSSGAFSNGQSQSFFFKLASMFQYSQTSPGVTVCMRTFGTSEPLQTFGYGVTTDTSDNIYVTGATQTFGGEDYDVFLQKYDTSCNLLYTQQWGGQGNDIPHGITTDTLGNVYVAGSTDSFGNGLTQIFLLKYNTEGRLLFSQTWGTHNSFGAGLAVDNFGNIYVVGTTSNGNNAASSQIVLLEYDSSGDFLNEKTTGIITQNSYGTGVALDSVGDIYVTGYGYGLGPTPGASAVILLKYDPSGNLVFQTTWGGMQNDAATSIAVDIDGNVYLTGYTKSYSVTPDIPSAFLLKFDPAGNLVFQRVWGGHRGDYGYGVAVDTLEGAYVTGYTFSFGSPNSQGASFFILKYDISGNLQYTKLYSGGIPIQTSGNGNPNPYPPP